MRNCLVIYVGNGYSENVTVYDKSYTYSVDMRDNFHNHQEKIFEPLKRLGYKVDTALLTNKHEYYQDFVNFYNAINLDYDDFTDGDFEILKSFYFWRDSIPPGWFTSGGRFFKLKKPIPQYETYVIVRADAHFIMGIHDLKIDFSKMNWLWPETDYRVFTDRDEYLKVKSSDCWCWEDYNRVNGNVLNIIPNKFFNAYSKYIWMEHMSFTYMLRDLYPLVTLNDLNMMLGYDKCLVTDVRFAENPVYTINKKIVSVDSDANISRYGVKS
jgi:hypothetical protein